MGIGRRFASPGLSLSQNGTISGIPTVSGQYAVNVAVTDANLLSGTAGLVVSVEPLGAPGYWEVASDGGIFSYGGAQFYGSTGSLHLNASIVGMAATPDDAGYWLLGSDGGIFAFGDAVFYGSTGSMHLNAPIVGMTPTPDGGGYWLVASDGGIFAFGDAAFYGSTGGIPLDKPIVGMASTIDGDGYWLVASDGGVFAFGDAAFFGSTGGLPLQKPIVAHDVGARRRRLLAGCRRRRDLQLRRRRVLRLYRRHDTRARPSWASTGRRTDWGTGWWRATVESSATAMRGSSGRQEACR